MNKKLLRHGAWFAICDGKKALILENKGDAAYPKLETRQVFEQDNPPSREQGSAPPGRAFAGIGVRRGATEETDFHDQAEQAFLRSFAAALDGWVRDRGLHDLVLVAPPRALGTVRAALSDATRALLVAEVDRDYVKLPLYEIEQHLAHLP
jgi:protein required for attachment to host cells